MPARLRPAGFLLVVTMAEIAALGLRVDGVEGINRAAGALDRLSDASQKAEVFGDRLADAFKGFSAGQASMLSSLQSINSLLAQVAISTQKAGAESRKSTSEVDGFSATANKAATATQALNTALQAAGAKAAQAGKEFADIGNAAPKATSGMTGVAKSADEARKALAAISASTAGLNAVAASANTAALGVQGFVASAKSAQQTMREMQAQIVATNQVAAQMGASFASIVSAAQAVAKAQSDAAKSAADAGQAFKMAGDRVLSYSSASANAADVGQRAAKSMDATAIAARALTSALAVAGVGFGAQELIGMVDGYTKYTAQLKLATKSTTEQAIAMSSVSRIATDAQAGIGELATLYARISNATSEMGISQRKVADITETVALALKANGATASEASSAMLQLSQAFGSGVLRGEEFNAVYEAAPNLLRELAIAMGKPVGLLREMAAEGKLTASVLAEYLPSSLNKFREQAKEVQTIGGAFTVLKNNIMQMVGAQSNASGTTKALSAGINSLANNLELVAAAATGVAAIMGSRLVVSVGATTAAFVAQQVAVTRTAAAIAGAGVTTTASMVAMTAASRALSVASGFLLGPWGAAIALAGTGAAAFYAFGDSASALVKSIGGLNQPLDDLKRKIDALPPEKRIAIVLDIKEEAAKKAKEAALSFDDLAATVIGAFSGARAASADSARQVNDLVERLNNAKKTGADMTPVLRDAAKAAAVSNTTLKSWLELAANIRAARDAANAGAQVPEIIGAGGGRGSINPPTVGEIAASARTQAKAALDATKAYQSQAEQMANVRQEGDKLRTALKDLSQSNQGSSKFADQLRERLKGVDERLAAIAKRGQEGASAAKAEQSEYARLMASITGKIELNKEELKYGHKLNDAEKLRVMLTAQLEAGSKKLTAAHFAKAKAALEEFDQTEKQIKAAEKTKSLLDKLAQESEKTQQRNAYEQLFFDIQKNSLKLSDEQLDKAIGLATAIDMVKELEEQRTTQINLQNSRYALQNQLIAEGKSYLADLDSYGLGDKAAREMRQRAQIQTQAAAELAKLEQARQSAVFAKPEDADKINAAYAAQSEDLRQALQTRLDMYDGYLIEVRQKESDWQLGFQQSMQNYIDKSQDLYSLAGQSMTGFLSSAQEAVSSNFMAMLDGTKSVGNAFADMARSMANSVIKALVDMAAQWLVYQAVQLLVGRTAASAGAAGVAANAQATALQAGISAFASTAAIPIVGPALAPGAMAAALAITEPIAATIAGLSLAGMAHDGIDSVPTTGTWLLEKGERVTTAKTSARLDSVLERIDARQRQAREASSQGHNYREGAAKAPKVVLQLMGSEFQGAQITEERGETEDEVIVRVVSKDLMRGGQIFGTLQSISNVRRMGR